jgi:hypothetical protein
LLVHRIESSEQTIGRIESFDPKKGETYRKATVAETRTPSLTLTKLRPRRRN